jgi:hypothetical protein
MANQTHIPASPACGQWETLLADALDGHLRPEDEEFFTSHMSTCPACAVLFEEAKRGREWLDYLSTEPEIPVGLLDKILAATGPGQAAGFGLLPNQMQPALAGGVVAMPQPWQKPGFMGFIRRFAEPRLMMTAAMAFFSIALTLNLAGVKLSNLRLANFRPHAVRSYMERQFAFASTPIIRYYDHLRFVYEVQTRMRELRESTQGEQTQQPPNGGGQSQHTPGQKNGGSKVDPRTTAPQESAKPAYDDTDFLESSLQLQNGPTHFGESHSGGFGKAGERSTEWIA